MVAARRIGGWPGPIERGGDFLWAANIGDDTVSRIDPVRRIVLDTFFATTPLDLAWRDGVMWIANGNSYDGPDPPGGGTIERYGVRSGELTQTRIAPPTDALPIARIPVANGPRALAMGQDSVWVTGEFPRSGVWRIDPRTERAVAHIAVPNRANGVAVGAGGVWVTSWTPGHAGPGSVSRIGPTTNRLVATIDLGFAPQEVAVANGLVWVVVGPM